MPGWEASLIAPLVRATMASEIGRLKQFEDENGKLKHLVADLTLDKTMVSQWSANVPSDNGERTSCRTGCSMQNPSGF